MFENQDQANRAFRENCSPRYLRLDAFEKWAKGTQYEGKVSWWDDSVPLWERQPCVVYPVVHIAAGSYVDLLLGNQRFPEFSTKLGEDESDEDNGLDPEESAAVDRFIREYHKICKYRAASREVLMGSQQSGSACEIHGVRNGKPFTDVLPAKWCEPKLGVEGEVVELEVRYPYIEQYRQQNGKWAVRAKLYRRVIDQKRDVEYLPAAANENGIEPSWRENKERTVEHNLGFCPVVWYPFMRGCAPVNEIDGQPIHATITDEIHQHDIARSQWHRGALLSEPQIVEIGVDGDHNPTELGRPPVIISTEHGGILGPKGVPTAQTGKVTGGYGYGAGQKARKKGPGYPWRYPDPETKVQQLTYPGDALKSQEDNCRDLRIKLQEALSVVFLDPESIKFAATTSGKALEAIKQKQLDRCDQIRDDLTDRYFEPSISMQLRIADAIMSRGQKLRVPGAQKVKPILAKFREGGEWQIPTLQVRWGSYFAPDPAEQKVIVEMVLKALEAGVPLLTVKVAIQKLAPIFGIENVTAFIEDLENERLERQAEADERAAQAAEREQQSLHARSAKMVANATADHDDGREDDAVAGAGARGRKKPSGAN
jgi:hypothetical protein